MRHRPPRPRALPGVKRRGKPAHARPAQTKLHLRPIVPHTIAAPPQRRARARAPTPCTFHDPAAALNCGRSSWLARGAALATNQDPQRSSQSWPPSSPSNLAGTHTHMWMDACLHAVRCRSALYVRMQWRRHLPALLEAAQKRWIDVQACTAIMRTACCARPECGVTWVDLVVLPYASAGFRFME